MALIVAGCSHAVKPVVMPPTIVEVPKLMPLPSECVAKQKLALPKGSTASDVMEQQHAALLAYEAQVERCFKQ